MKKSIILSILCTLLLSSSAFAQSTETSDIEATENSLENTPSIFQQALNATPPERSSYGLRVFNSREAVTELDQWIKDAPNNDPKSLVVKDIIQSLPPAFAGPRIVKLAKKSTDPATQKTWARWLSKYPDAYSAVLKEWLLDSLTQQKHYLNIFTQYFEVQPDDAINLWTNLIRNNPLSQIQQIAELGYHQTSCANALISSFKEAQDETQKLRLQRATVRCKNPVSMNEEQEEMQNLKNILTDELNRDTISIRMVALSLLASDTLPQHFVSGFQEKLLSIYNHAKNSTERSMALLALNQCHAPDQNKRLADALKNGDETLRFQAADILSRANTPILNIDELKQAFQKELWPDTQQKLYDALAKFLSGPERTQLQKSIIADPERPLNMRISAINDMDGTNSDAFKLKDMADLQNAEEPVELIAAAAEYLYKNDPSARPKLRQWIAAQQPFERRILSTFALFIRTDERNQDASFLDTMRTICDKATEQQNILMPCIHYLTSHAQTESDKELIEKLQNRRDQIDAITGFEL